MFNCLCISLWPFWPTHFSYCVISSVQHEWHGRFVRSVLHCIVGSCVCFFLFFFFAYLVLLARSCMPWCSQRAAQLLSLTGPSSAWPQLCEKGHHTNTASLKHNVAYAQLRKPHQTFLQSSALCGFSLWRPCEAKCFQTISRFHVETLHTKKEEKKIEELCIFTHAAG